MTPDSVELDVDVSRLEITCKEEVLSWEKVLSWNLAGGTEGSKDIPQSAYPLFQHILVTSQIRFALLSLVFSSFMNLLLLLCWGSERKDVILSFLLLLPPLLILLFLLFLLFLLLLFFSSSYSSSALRINSLPSCNSE